MREENNMKYIGAIKCKKCNKEVPWYYIVPQKITEELKVTRKTLIE